MLQRSMAMVVFGLALCLTASSVTPAIAEECGRYRECQAYRALYGNTVFVIEYRAKDFKRDCKKKKLRKQLSIVLRDRNVTQPGSGSYVYRAC